MFANAFPFLPVAVAAEAGNFRPEKCQTLLINCSCGCSLISNVGQPLGFFKHLF